MLLILLFFLFLIWSYILSTTAHFLIHNRFRLSLPTTLQTVLLFACASSFVSLWLTILPQYPLFFMLASALWITIFTDLDHMLISRLASLYLIPVGIIANYYDVLMISPQESIIAAFFTMGILLLINILFCKIKGYNGLGQGDIELMGCIAAWLGCIGAWFTLLIGSTIGVISCLCYMLWTRTTISMIPFGPFLALGSLVFMIFSKEIINFLIIC
jgi:leader peptidase (prepilin peptidase) / N-methyltransferase